MKDVVGKEGLRNPGQNTEHVQTRPHTYGNAQAPNNTWRPYVKEGYSENLVENQMPNSLNFSFDLTAVSVRRPSSEPLTPHYRTERMQRSGTETPVIKRESAMMPHTPAPVSQYIGTGQDPHLSELRSQTSTVGRLAQQADTLQVIRPSEGLAMSAEDYHLRGPNYAHTNPRSQPPLYQSQYSQYSYDGNGTGGFSEQTRAADQSRLSAADPPFYSNPPHHQDKSLLQPHYDALRHDLRPQQYQSRVATQYNPQFTDLQLNNTMSLSFETRQFPDYPQTGLMHDPHQDQEEMQQPRYPSPPPPLSENPYNPQPTLDAAATLMDDMPDFRQKSESDAASPGRSKPIPKPARDVTKDADGRFVCTWPGCTEEVRDFGRKCEWSKHMDKHDRPYKCPSEGCEKLPGFTYSGGLLRHQREVHGLHGGPRKQLNCPHPTCKRYSGKGFSRQENLNEHLRRVHTDGSEMPVGEETEDDGNERTGMKRKRGSTREDDFDWRQEIARLRQENEEMKRTTQNLMRQLQSLQGIVGSSIQRAQQSHQGPPTANML